MAPSINSSFASSSILHHLLPFLRHASDTESNYISERLSTTQSRSLYPSRELVRHCPATIKLYLSINALSFRTRSATKAPSAHFATQPRFNYGFTWAIKVGFCRMWKNRGKPLPLFFTSTSSSHCVADAFFHCPFPLTLLMRPDRSLPSSLHYINLVVESTRPNFTYSLATIFTLNPVYQSINLTFWPYYFAFCSLVHNHYVSLTSSSHQEKKGCRIS